MLTLGLSVLSLASERVDSLAVADSLDLIPDSVSQTLGIQPMYILESGESADRRWISLVMEDSVGALPVSAPVIVADGGEGTFSIVLNSFDTTRYQGNRMLRDHGHFPIHYTVYFPDSCQLEISGKTLPYDDINSYYSFIDNAYRFEFIFSDRESTLSGSKSLALPKQQAETASASLPAKLAVDNQTRSYMQLFSQSLKIASLALLLILVGIIVYYGLKKIRSRQSAASSSFAEVLQDKTTSEDEKTSAVEKAPIVLTPEMREEKIRALMEHEKISYDEAALRVQYESLNGDGTSGS